MKNGRRNFRVMSFLAMAGILVMAAPVQAAVTWVLNPENKNESVGSSSRTYTSDGFSIVARGFDNDKTAPTPDTPHTLFYKNSSGDLGLGLDGTLNNELQVNANGNPVNYIQFDLTSILAAGFTNGQIMVDSVEPGELWDLYGSSAQGVLGTKISLPAGGYGSSTNDIFVNIPQFGNFNFVSIASRAFDMLPVKLRADMPVIPEVGGASLALILLAFFALVGGTRYLRTRSQN